MHSEKPVSHGVPVHHYVHQEQASGGIEPLTLSSQEPRGASRACTRPPAGRAGLGGFLWASLAAAVGSDPSSLHQDVISPRSPGRSDLHLLRNPTQLEVLGVTPTSAACDLHVRGVLPASFIPGCRGRTRPPFSSLARQAGSGRRFLSRSRPHPAPRARGGA